MILLKDKLDELTAYPEMSAFRGQVDSKWRLTSGATRRLIDKQFDGDEDAINTPAFPRIYNIYHSQVLIGPARRHGFGIVQGHRISDLQLLAKLQHSGAGTGLLDFTWNPFIALWFACATAAKGIKACEGDGKVFVLNLNDPNKFRRVGTDEEQQRVPDLFSPSSQESNLNKTRYWEPAIEGEASHRMINQRSVFVIGCPLVPEDAIDGNLVVHSSEKEQLVKELATFFDITNASLFMDMNGFSVANGAGSDMEKLDDPVKLLLQGNQFLQQKDWHQAIASYDLCIELAPDVSETYFLRGNAKAELGNYSDALDDYDAAIQHQDRPFHPYLWMIYFNRANVRFVMDNPEEALVDYERTGQATDLPLPPSLYFNHANTLVTLGDFQPATVIYDMAIHLGYHRAYFNKGNTLVMLGKFDEALSCYDKLLREEPSFADASRNRYTLQRILALINNCERYDFRQPKNSERPMTFKIVLQTDSHDGSQVVNFCGNIGNTGNLGFNTPGGKGFRGEPDFSVKVSFKSAKT